VDAVKHITVQYSDNHFLHSTFSADYLKENELTIRFSVVTIPTYQVIAASGKEVVLG
jgi:hypothetical protein